MQIKVLPTLLMLFLWPDNFERKMITELVTPTDDRLKNLSSMIPCLKESNFQVGVPKHEKKHWLFLREGFMKISS